MNDWHDYRRSARPLDPYPQSAQREDARRAAQQRERHLEELDELQQATRDVQQATLDVHAVVEQLAHETAKAQKLAIWIGVGTAVLGAVIGGFAGAVAARFIGS